MSRGPDDAFLRDVSGRLGLAMVNLYTKFQVSNYTTGVGTGQADPAAAGQIV